MNAARLDKAAWIVAGLLSAVAVADPPASGPATRPAGPRAWGPLAAWLRIGAAAPDSVALGEPVVVHLFAESLLGRDAAVPARQLTAYALLATGKTLYYTEPLGVEPLTLTNRQAVGPLGRFDLMDCTLYPRHPGQKLGPDAYPVRPADEQGTPAAQVLAPGEWKLRVILYVPPAEGRPAVVAKGNVLGIEITDVPFAKLDPAARRARIERLAASIRRDAFAAQRASEAADAIGPAAVDALIEATGKDEPAFARMWAAAALAHIADAKALACLDEWADRKDATICSVAAYHLPRGPNRAEALKLVRRLSAPEQPEGVRVWAARGWLTRRHEVPPDVLTTMLADGSGKVRYTAALILSRSAGAAGKAQKVAEAQAAPRDLDQRTIAELVAALSKLDPLRRRIAVHALQRMTGQKLTTPPQWRNWLAKPTAPPP